jgi:hypothetical protein
VADILALRRRTGSTGGDPGGRVAELVRSHGLTGLVRPASAHVPQADGVGERILPVLPELRGLLPTGGLRRGSTVAVATRGPGPFGATSVLLALLAAASAAGSWCAVVGMPALGLVAAAEFGIALDRLALVPDPGPEWPAVVAALLDGIDVVVAAPPGPVSASMAGRLAARARQRGSVLVPYGRWAGADVVLETPGGGWSGLGQGRGRLSSRALVISRRGRGAAARHRQVTVWIPRDFSSPPVETVPMLKVSGARRGVVWTDERRLAEPAQVLAHEERSDGGRRRTRAPRGANDQISTAIA